MDDCNRKFPTPLLLPRARTEVESFCNKFPDFDGRGIVICIMDTGVDPSAPGLQVTTDGKPKILDLVDTSGAGDVTLSEVIPVESIKDGKIDGLSGRKLKIPSEWLSRTTGFRLGIKGAWELFPEALISRVSKEFEQKKWLPTYRELLAKAHCLKSKNEKVTPFSVEEEQKRDEALAHEECLLALNKKFTYLGDAFDVVSFRDETDGSFYACLDKNCSGDLSQAKLMRAFREDREYDTLDPVSLMNYSFRFHDDGKCLEIVTCGSPHGTHVAAIAAAHFPDEPERNGIAPGAQIISLRIGDNRLRGMETGTSLMRACYYIARSEADLVNYSFGEACHLPNCGKVCEAMTNLVFKHNVIYCSSSGNHGPALGTVGAPGGTQDCIIGIAPVVYPEMMEVEYSATEVVNGGCYSWSSRGPTSDGDWGMSVAAPGAAITSVPKWTLKNGQLMNGSSMSSPNGCGSIAVLLSALKQSNLEYNPFSVQRAIFNTAEILHPDRFGQLDQGRGVIKVERAWNYYLRFPRDLADHFRFKVRVNHTHRGIYVREWEPQPKPRSFTVTVTPEPQDGLEMTKRGDFDLKLVLTCEAPWVSIPKFLFINNGTRTFMVLVDPSHLSSDSLNVAEIKAFDSSAPEKGPIFYIPIIVIIPVKAVGGEILSYRENLKAGGIRRNFVAVPSEAVGCQLRLRCTNFALSTSRVVIHCSQAVPFEHYKSREVLRNLNLRDDLWEEFYFPVMSGRTLEVCLARWWAVPGMCELEWTINFSGLHPSASQVAIMPGEQFAKVFVTSHFEREELHPSAQITHLVVPIRPSNCELCPTCARDMSCDNEILFAMKLTYNFNLSKSTEISPSFPVLNDVLYESDYSSQLWQVYDSQKRFVCAGDYKTEKYAVKMEKGDYQLFLVVKNHTQAQLDRIKDMSMLLALKQTSTIPIEFFPSLPHLSVNMKCTSMTPYKSSVRSVFVMGPPEEKIPKFATPGSFLQGTISFHQQEKWKKAITYPLKIGFAEIAGKRSVRKTKSGGGGGGGGGGSGGGGGGGGDDEKTPTLVDLKENMRTLRIAALQKIEKEDEKDAFYEELRQELGAHDPDLCFSRLLSLDPKCRAGVATAREFVTLMTVLVEAYACDKFAHYCVSKEESYDAKFTAKMEKQKTQLLETLTRSGSAICAFVQSSSEERTEEAQEMMAEGEKVFSLVKKWCDLRDAKVSAFLTEYFLAKKLHASALKLLLKVQEEKSSKETELKIIQVMRKLGWDELASFYQNQLPLKYPHDYRAW